MDHDSDVVAVSLEELQRGSSISYVEAEMAIRRPKFSMEPFDIRSGGGLFAEERATHVVVDADDVKAKVGELLSGCRSDEASRSCDQGHGHVSMPPSARAQHRES